MTADDREGGATLVLPGELRELAGGSAAIGVEGGTVREALSSLRAALPAVYDRLVDERGEVRPHLHIFVGAAEIRRAHGLETPVADGEEIVVLRAVSGG